MKTLNYQPARLTDAELENPLHAISNFFSDRHLHDTRDDTREKLWDLYKGWINVSECSIHLYRKKKPFILTGIGLLLDWFATGLVLV